MTRLSSKNIPNQKDEEIVIEEYTEPMKRLSSKNIPNQWDEEIVIEKYTEPKG